MTTGIGSLAPGLDGHGLRKGIGDQGITKNKGKPSQFTLGSRMSSYCPLKEHYIFAHFPLDTTTDPHGTIDQLILFFIP
jgi:hypothetical protein